MFIYIEPNQTFSGGGGWVELGLYVQVIGQIVQDVQQHRSVKSTKVWNVKKRGEGMRMKFQIENVRTPCSGYDKIKLEKTKGTKNGSVRGDHSGLTQKNMLFSIS